MSYVVTWVTKVTMYALQGTPDITQVTLQLM